MVSLYCFMTSPTHLKLTDDLSTNRHYQHIKMVLKHCSIPIEKYYNRDYLTNENPQNSCIVDSYIFILNMVKPT